jgi:hypothetical protein
MKDNSNVGFVKGITSFSTLEFYDIYGKKETVQFFQNFYRDKETNIENLKKIRVSYWSKTNFIKLPNNC